MPRRGSDEAEIPAGLHALCNQRRRSPNVCARNGTASVTALGLELCNETQLPQQCSVGPIIFLWLCASGSPSMKGLPRVMLH